jgi:hypothetical protein
MTLDKEGKDRFNKNINIRRKEITRDWKPSVKPYLIRNMLRPDLHGYNNVCSTVRDIYLITDDEEIKIRCRVAIRMQKSMDAKLRWYKSLFDNLREKGIIDDEGTCLLHR